LIQDPRFDTPTDDQADSPMLVHYWDPFNCSCLLE
jgi:hypothetical protein